MAILKRAGITSRGYLYASLVSAGAIAMLAGCSSLRQRSDFWTDGGAGAGVIGGHGGYSGGSAGGGGSAGAAGTIGGRGGAGVGGDEGRTRDSGVGDSDTSDGPPVPFCGNGIKESGESCDDGAAQNVGGYGKCNADCSRGPYCGDAKINGPGEACDEGANNGLGLGQCNPACTGTVANKAIKPLSMYLNLIPSAGNLTADWDAFCMNEFGQNYLALLVDGNFRRASLTPYAGDGQQDWVLAPYTRYVNATQELLWTTDQVALLGVRNGGPADLVSPFVSGVTLDVVWVGFNSDWTTSTSTCKNWTDSTNSELGMVMALSSRRISTSPSSCGTASYLLCVEQ